jgi:hypothetical protein
MKCVLILIYLIIITLAIVELFRGGIFWWIIFLVYHLIAIYFIEKIDERHTSNIN